MANQGTIIVTNAGGASPFVLVCEHASHYIPAQFQWLGLTPEHRESHAAWDPGAAAVAQVMSAQLDAPLVASGVSRLIYDCNRPPDAPDAMPAKSEMIDVPGNANLSAQDRQTRTDQFYRPFQAALATVISEMAEPIIVTIHSFTPVFHGQKRDVEIGILHDSDTRLADALIDSAAAHTTAAVARNQPYGPEHGVTHTLKEHAIKAGHPNVMLEIRNDLIATADQQQAFGLMIARWLTHACARLELTGFAQ
ncbi:N-formylglutamate amidohydrolase [Yoonia sediminilitoris]|uniref:Putative N-formylglutamate amidohydrolase n=1 Tax=Yoonia sediminilitoris TaxID=1286148 RepID=A0A2T6KQP4_9RHOB|nr:N-formylglutamate amidohydrolase [Yoonia sediminilitoris]PUB18855.1 putative N-formylglutamate amidohydrolase [Yoonia sediminilitoris]RCW99023.1 putative N-formylglutamate amidohydrolase [Yoonia sediminilitoris]